MSVDWFVEKAIALDDYYLWWFIRLQLLMHVHRITFSYPMFVDFLFKKRNITKQSCLEDTALTLGLSLKLSLEEFIAFVVEDIAACKEIRENAGRTNSFYKLVRDTI